MRTKEASLHRFTISQHVRKRDKVLKKAEIQGKDGDYWAGILREQKMDIALKKLKDKGLILGSIPSGRCSESDLDGIDFFVTVIGKNNETKMLQFQVTSLDQKLYKKTEDKKGNKIITITFGLNLRIDIICERIMEEVYKNI